MKERGCESTVRGSRSGCKFGQPSQESEAGVERGGGGGESRDTWEESVHLSDERSRYRGRKLERGGALPGEELGNFEQRTQSSPGCGWDKRLGRQVGPEMPGLLRSWEEPRSGWSWPWC